MMWRLAVAVMALLCAAPGCGLIRSRSTEPLAGAKPVKREASESLDLSICLETAELARTRGMDEEAIEQFTRARQIDPNVTGVAHPLAVLYDRAGRADAAEREYLAALEEEPHDPDVLCDYGYFLYSRDRFEEAEAKLRESLERSPGASASADQPRAGSRFSGRVRRGGGVVSPGDRAGGGIAQRGDVEVACRGRVGGGCRFAVGGGAGPEFGGDAGGDRCGIGANPDRRPRFGWGEGGEIGREPIRKGVSPSRGTH